MPRHNSAHGEKQLQRRIARLAQREAARLTPVQKSADQHRAQSRPDRKQGGR